MHKVAFWQIQDTVVNIHEPSQTFEVVAVEKRHQGTWVTLQNVHTKAKFSGYEIGIQRLGYVGYRKDRTAILVI
jgi:hypothetical protein